MRGVLYFFTAIFRSWFVFLIGLGRGLFVIILDILV